MSGRLILISAFINSLNDRGKVGWQPLTIELLTTSFYSITFTCDLCTFWWFDSIYNDIMHEQRDGDKNMSVGFSFKSQLGYPTFFFALFMRIVLLEIHVDLNSLEAFYLDMIRDTAFIPVLLFSNLCVVNIAPFICPRRLRFDLFLRSTAGTTAPADYIIHKLPALCHPRIGMPWYYPSWTDRCNSSRAMSQMLWFVCLYMDDVICRHFI